jgi:hypothetical protein
MVRFLSTGLLLLVCATVFAQAPAAAKNYREQARKDFALTNAAYSKLKSYRMAVHYRLYTNYTTTTAFESSDGAYIRQDNNIYSSLLGIVTLQNKQAKLTVNSASKTIVVANPDQLTAAPSNLQLDSSLKRCTSIDFVDLGEGRKRYVLHFDRTPFFEYDRMELEFRNDHLLERLVFYYREAVNLDETNATLKKEKPRLEISFSDIDLAPTLAADQFSEQAYILMQGKKILPASAYSDYRVLNHKH